MSSVWLSPEERGRALGYLAERFGIAAEAFAGHHLIRRGEYLYAVRREAEEACARLQWVAAGLKLLRVTGSGGFRPATRGIQVFGRWATRNTRDLSGEELRDLLEGRSLPAPGLDGFVLLFWGGAPVGVGLVRAGRLVGQLPRAVTEHLRLAPGRALL
ncbi:MAG: hypothetical protein Kow0092_14180 [Deferrisomatales bacterium]